MIKKIAALLLLICMLTGCGFTAQTNFNEIEYVRPDLEALRTAVDNVEIAVEYGESLRHITELLDECYELYYDFDTMYSLAQIKSCQDITDGYYAEELLWCEENFALVSQLMEELYYICGSSEMAYELEERYFWEGFAEEYAEPEDGFYNEGLMPLLSEEAQLMARYRAILANPTVSIDGGEVDYYSYISDCDDEEFYKAQWLYFDKYNKPLAEVYTSLVKLRHEIARTAGYEDYRQMQFEYFFERSYSPRQADNYVRDIREYLVPVYKELMAEVTYPDYEYLAEEELHDVLQDAADKMGGSIAAAFEFMSGHNYYDIEFSPLKADTSFQTYLPSYQAPFLFLDPYGDTGDILSFAHEFGHYVDAWYNGEIYENIDASECFSQAMEYLLLCYVDEDRQDELRLMKLLDTIELYVQQASFYEFEQKVYACDPDELDAEYLNQLSLELAMDYGYYDEASHDYYAMSWMDVPHFFEMPFYVISYPVSNDIALQIYDAELYESGAGLKLFNEMLENPHADLSEIVEHAGLESPFDKARAEHVAAVLSQIKKEVD